MEILFDAYQNLFKMCEYRKLNAQTKMKDRENFYKELEDSNFVPVNTKENICFAILKQNLTNEGRNNYIINILKNLMTLVVGDVSVPNTNNKKQSYHKIYVFYDSDQKSIQTSFLKDPLTEYKVKNKYPNFKIYILDQSMISIEYPKVRDACNHKVMSDSEIATFREQTNIDGSTGTFINELDPMLIWNCNANPDDLIEITRISERSGLTFNYRFVKKYSEQQKNQNQTSALLIIE